MEQKRQQERVRQAHMEVRFALEKSQANSVLSLDVPDPNNPRNIITLYEKDQIEAAAMADHKAKFTQVWDTPFMQEPLHNLIGPLGLNQTADEILQGTFNPPDTIDDETRNVIQHMRINDRVILQGPLRNGCTTREFQRFWKKRREKISSPMSGIHNGHYISAAQDDYLSKLTSILSSIPWTMGITPQRWMKSLNVEIEKKKGFRRLDKLRTIVLLEADFNTGTKMIYNKRMLDNSRQHDLIPDFQYLRKGARSVEAVIFKRLFFDLLPVGSIAC